MARPIGIPSHMKGKKTGRPAWNRGLKTSEEARNKQALAKIGKPGPWRNKKRPNISGEKCWNWKGEVSTKNHLIRNSIEMKNWRESVYQRDDYTCQLCLLKGVKLNAHHIGKFSENPGYRFDINNGITLCEPCHNKTKGRENELLQGFVDLLWLDEFLIQEATKTCPL